MAERYYIQVVLPVKLEWAPWYYSESELDVGTRVRVRLGRNVYIGFVLTAGGLPDIELKRIHPVLEVVSQLERISDEEIKLWRFVSDYYLCTIGEVYKAAYPALRVDAENKKPRRKTEESGNNHAGRLTGYDKKAVTEILDAFDDRKTVLLQAVSRQRIYGELINRTLNNGKDVLLLSPGAPRMSNTERRDVSGMLRSEKPVLVMSSRTAVFLPFHKLGLVIVDEEQDITYKQSSPAPRYNARDVSIVLAQLQEANVVLGSSAPSLESFYNVRTGKYQFVKSGDTAESEVLLIDTDAERKKNGMIGEMSRVLTAQMDAMKAARKKCLVINSWELGNISKLKLDKYSLVAILHFEFLFSRQDFRADEKAWQILEKLKSSVRGKLVIQTVNTSHPVFSGNVERMMEERKAVGLPPFTRQIAAKNKNGETTGQIFLPKDGNLAREKKRFFEEVSSVPEFSCVDVDPV